MGQTSSTGFAGTDIQHPIWSKFECSTGVQLLRGETTIQFGDVSPLNAFIEDPVDPVLENRNDFGPHRPRNATAERGATWLDGGRFLDGQLTFRMVFAEDDLLKRLRVAIDTGRASPEVAPYVLQTAFCSSEVFEAGGWDSCAAASRDSGPRSQMSGID